MSNPEGPVPAAPAPTADRVAAPLDPRPVPEPASLPAAVTNDGQGQPNATLAANESERQGAYDAVLAEAQVERPSFIFFGVVAAVSLVADVASKAWAEVVLSRRPFDEPSIVLLKKHLTFTLAYNKGGAWGLLQDAPETVRRPFFFFVSVLAVLFIVSLYSKLGKSQLALSWGLPLVLGGALGNLSDRVTRSSVIDFIDYRADWVLAMNRAISQVVPGWGLTDHWPTFNVADIAICVGVGLMAVDMFTSRRGPERVSSPVGGTIGV